MKYGLLEQGHLNIMIIEGLRKPASDEPVGSIEHRPSRQKRWLMTHNEKTKMAGAFTTLAGAAHKIKLINIKRI